MHILNRSILSFAILCLTVGSGCASYWSDRAADAADCLSFSVEDSLGAKAQAGIFHGGLMLAGDSRGLKGGSWTGTRGSNPSQFDGQMDLTLIAGGIYQFRPSHPRPRLRGKEFSSSGFVLWVPQGVDKKNHLPYLTQFEVAAGLRYGARVGFNPGEMLDLLVGFFGLDLYDDDIWTTRDERIAIRVFDTQGKPLQSVSIAISDGEGYEWYRSDEDGLILSARLPGSHATVTTWRSGHFEPHPNFEVDPDTKEGQLRGTLARGADELVLIVDEEHGRSSDD